MKKLTTLLALVLVGSGVLAASSLGRTSTTVGLAFVKNEATANSVFVADANGTGQRRLGAGYDALLSPDGQLVAAASGSAHGRQLVVYRAGGGTLTSVPALDRQQVEPLAWSPDSTYLAVALTDTSAGTGIGNARLDVIDVATGKITATEAGIVNGASFAPSGADQVVYGVARSQSIVGAVNLYSVPADGSTPPTQLTHDGNSLFPVWGSRGIVFVRERSRGQVAAPAYHLELLHGTTVTPVASPAASPLVDGLLPVAVSADGEHVVAEFTGEDTGETYAVDLTTDRYRKLPVGRYPTLACGISQDGDRVLISYGDFESPSSDQTIATIPFGGGRATTLVKGGDEPSWDR